MHENQKALIVLYHICVFKI